ncbi:MAG TPA: hypothetical protein PKB07_28000 [Flavilitoribacter sp.]|nr:hypothetical protein [Flavilitoribacter sp.]
MVKIRFHSIFIAAVILLGSGCLKDRTTERACSVPCVTDRTLAEIDYPGQADRKIYCRIKLSSDCTYSLENIQDCTAVETGTWTFSRDRRPLLTGQQFPGDFIGTVRFSIVKTQPFGGTDREFYHYWELRTCDGDRLEVYEFWEIEDCACYYAGDYPTRYFE